jgi:hypothetical protein
MHIFRYALTKVVCVYLFHYALTKAVCVCVWLRVCMSLYGLNSFNPRRCKLNAEEAIHLIKALYCTQHSTNQLINTLKQGYGQVIGEDCAAEFIFQCTLS